MLEPHTEAFLSDAQSVFPLPFQRVLYSSLLQWARLKIIGAAPAAEWTLDLLLHFSQSVSL